MNNIQVLRKKRGLKQSQIAAVLDVTQQAVAKWETGASLPRSELLPKLAEILHCTVDDLLRPADTPEQKENPRDHGTDLG